MFNPGFFGKTPPKWFLGQVPLGQTANKEDPNGWGDRVKVRIVGYHPAEGSKLADKDLDWAIILRTTSNGTLNRMSTGITGGEWVIGIFINTDLQKPLPLILGVLGKIDAPAAVVNTLLVPAAVFPVTVVNVPAAPVPATTLYCRVAIEYVPAVPAAHVMSMYGEVGVVALDTDNEARVGAAAVGATSAPVVNAVPAVSGLICPEASIARKKMV